MACKISIHRKMRAQRQKIWQEVLLHILEDTTTMQALIRSIKASQKEGGGAAIMLTTLCTFMADNVWHVPFKKLWYLMRISTRASSFHHHQQQYRVQYHQTLKELEVIDMLQKLLYWSTSGSILVDHTAKTKELQLMVPTWYSAAAAGHSIIWTDQRYFAHWARFALIKGCCRI